MPFINRIISPPLRPVSCLDSLIVSWSNALSNNAGEQSSDSTPGKGFDDSLGGYHGIIGIAFRSRTGRGWTIILSFGSVRGSMSNNVIKLKRHRPIDVFITYDGKRPTDITVSRYAVRQLVSAEVRMMHVCLVQNQTPFERLILN